MSRFSELWFVLFVLAADWCLHFYREVDGALSCYKECYDKMNGGPSEKPREYRYLTSIKNKYCEDAPTPQHPCMYLRKHKSVSVWVYLSVSVYLSVCIHVYICLSVCPSVCQSVHLSVRLSIRLSVCPSVCPSVHLSVSTDRIKTLYIKDTDNVWLLF